MSQLLGVMLCIVAVGPVGHAAAQLNYPEKSVRYVVPFPAGGAADMVARTISSKLSERLGRNVIVDNRAGASGNIGSELAARAAPDGYTIVQVVPAFVINPSFYKLSFDAVKDFAPIAQTVVSQYVLVVHPSVPARTLPELITLAKARPRGLTYGSSGTGSGVHIASELFKSMAGIDMVHIPYKGAAPAMTELMAGQISLMFDVFSTSLPQMKAGKIRALAVAGAKRSSILPDLPRVADTLPGFDVVGWQGTLAPAGTPRDIVLRLNREILAVLALPDVRQRLTDYGFEVAGGSPEQFAELIRTDMAKFAKVIKAAGVKPD